MIYGALVSVSIILTLVCSVTHFLALYALLTSSSLSDRIGPLQFLPQELSSSSVPLWLHGTVKDQHLAKTDATRSMGTDLLMF